MAVLSFLDLIHDGPFQNVKTNFHWSILKDSLYYYKMVEEQNMAALGDYMLQNLMYMMDEKNFITGINPVADIYCMDQLLLGYRSKIIDGISLKQFSKTMENDWQKWDSFFQNLIGILKESSCKDYIFPDLFTDGNILISNDTMNIYFIDNDGIQIQNRFVGYYDDFAKHIINSLSNPPTITHKYFDLSEKCFTPQYTSLALYAWFFSHFFQIDLVSILISQSHSNFIQILKSIGFPIHSNFVNHCLNLFSLEQKNCIEENDFSEIFDQYLIQQDGEKRVLIPR